MDVREETIHSIQDDHSDSEDNFEDEDDTTRIIAPEGKQKKY